MGTTIIVVFTIFIIAMIIVVSDGSEKRNRDYYESTFSEKFPGRDINKTKIIDTSNYYMMPLKLGKNDYYYMDFDDEKKTITVATDDDGKENARTFAYNDILDYEVIQDGKSTFSPSLTGLIGLGSAAPKHEMKKIEDWKIVLRLNDFMNPFVNIVLINRVCEIDSPDKLDSLKKTAEEILATLAYAKADQASVQIVEK